MGILFCFLAFFFTVYLVAAEYTKPPKGKGEILVFASGKIPSKATNVSAADAESQHHTRAIVERGEGSDSVPGFTTGTEVFHWEDLCYDISHKGGERRLLDHADGWVKPGTSTALMVCTFFI